MDKDAQSMGIGGVPFPLCQGCLGFLDGEFKGSVYFPGEMFLLDCLCIGKVGVMVKWYLRVQLYIAAFFVSGFWFLWRFCSGTSFDYLQSFMLYIFICVSFILFHLSIAL